MKKVEVWRHSQNKTTTEVVTNSKNNKHEMFVVDTKYSLLDMCINDVQMQSDKLFSILNLLWGQPPHKKTKVKDLKHTSMAWLNSWIGKAKLVMLKCLLDTGTSGCLVAKQLTRNYTLGKVQETRPFGQCLAETYKPHISVSMHLCISLILSRPSDQVGLTYVVQLGGIQYDNRTWYSVSIGNPT